ncbi:MAG: glycoside-pentoside-hexuronide (GPH):cation symporter [Clostridia bacterium]
MENEIEDGASSAELDLSLKPTYRKFGMRDKIGYALGDFGCNLSFALIGTYMLDFYTQFIGLQDWQWAIIIIITKIWDGINDPIMGAIMDAKRVGHAKSKFKPWIKIGSIGLIFSCALVFLPIPVKAGGNGNLQVAICILTYLLWDVCYTLVNVPYGSLNSAISGDPNERTSLSTFRSIGAALGSLVCMVLPFILYEGEENARNLKGERLVWVALILGILAFFAYHACIRMTTERFSFDENVNEKFSIKKTAKAFFCNRPLIAMCVASMALIIFFSSTTATVKWLAQCYLYGNADKMIFLATVITYLPIILVLPFVGKLVRKFGKKLSAGVPFIISVVATMILMLIPLKPFDKNSTIVFIAGLAVIQFGGGIFQFICWAMITDCIDYQQLRSGDRLEGSVYAFYSLFRKIAQGIAMALPLLCMTRFAGFQPRLDNIVNQSAGVPEKMMLVTLTLVLIGSLLMVFSLLVAYNLGKNEVDNIGKQLGRNEVEEGEIVVDEV